MSEKNVKTKLWVYAVVLFSSAFIVLLLTAYSQIKMNFNINDYKNKIFNTQTEKNKFMMDFKTASKQLERLNKEADKLKEDLNTSNKQIEELKDQNQKLNADADHEKIVYETLLMANNEYEKGNIVACAEILLRNMDISSLSNNGKALYENLKETTFKKAALLIYREGYDYYRKGIYSAAEKRFEKSLNFADTEYFSDDCYFLMACSEYWLGNKENVKGYLETLSVKYPDSNYYDDAQKLIIQLK